MGAFTHHAAGTHSVQDGCLGAPRAAREHCLRHRRLAVKDAETAVDLGTREISRRLLLGPEMEHAAPSSPTVAGRWPRGGTV